MHPLNTRSKASFFNAKHSFEPVLGRFIAFRLLSRFHVVCCRVKFSSVDASHQPYHPFTLTSHIQKQNRGREIAWKLKALSNNKKIKKFCRLSFPPKTRNKRFNRADALNDVRRTPEGRRSLVASGGWRPSCSTPQQQRDSRSAWLSPFGLTLKIRFDASWGEA